MFHHSSACSYNSVKYENMFDALTCHTVTIVLSTVTFGLQLIIFIITFVDFLNFFLHSVRNKHKALRGTHHRIVSFLHVYCMYVAKVIFYIAPR